MSERRQAEADSADGQGTEDVPYFIARNRSRMADDQTTRAAIMGIAIAPLMSDVDQLERFLRTVGIQK